MVLPFTVTGIINESQCLCNDWHDRRPRLLVAGETGNLGANVGTQQLKDVMNGEMDHTIYQGLSRGCSRITIDGQAMPSRVWLVHDDMRMQFRFEELLKNVEWEAWVPQATVIACKRFRERSETGEWLQRIQKHLQSLPPEVKKLSTRRLKEAVQAQAMDSLSWTRLIKRLDEHWGWRRDGRSLVRS